MPVDPDLLLLSTLPNAISLKDFVVLLDLDNQMNIPPNPQANLDGQYSEEQRFHHAIIVLRRIDMEQNGHDEYTKAKLAAYYLPQLVEKFLGPLPIHDADPEAAEDLLLKNAYMVMLQSLAGSPYMVKYLKSSYPIAGPGKRLLSVVARRLVLVGPRWNRMMEDHPKSKEFKDAAVIVLPFLGTCLMALRYVDGEPPKLDLNAKDGQDLSVLLHVWWMRFPDDPVGTISELICHNLGEYFEYEEALRLGAYQEPPKIECALPSCQRQDNLRFCKRCHNVKYCSAQHQKIHWYCEDGSEGLPHELVCFSTQY
ncbi:hypothetical protein HGRIS_012925 [Hohenbuehelia grisea]|uniref:MYND-type domain-containing protein n=1 Tax=Hohenbuehelia grisea TaxID=104357 RepID=A0ABR3ITX6_9AGAR